jgi:ribosomal protein S18 acetylase RimI-like enzyme
MSAVRSVNAADAVERRFLFGRLVIREANLGDCAGIARVQVDSYQTAYAGILPSEYLAHFSYEEQEQDWRALLSADQHDLLYVAENDSGEIVGYALGRAHSDQCASYDSELVALHVRRADQRQGIGKQLIAAVAERLKQQGCQSLMLWVLEQNPARSFYERLGGQRFDERPWRIEELGLDTTEVAYGWPDITTLLRS